MQDHPPAASPAPENQAPIAPAYAPPAPPVQSAYVPPYAPPLAAAAQPPPTTPTWIGQPPPAGTPPPAGPGYPPAWSGAPGNGAPSEYKTAAIFMLVGSITTLLASGFWFLLLIAACFGCCWLPLAGLTIWALVCAAQAIGGTRVRNIRLACTLALVASIFTLDPVGFVMQILALVWLSRPDVSSWLERSD